VRLPAFRFLIYFGSYFVIAGPDPAIHAAKRLEQNSDWLTLWHVSMDHRVKPSGDEESLFDNVDRKNARAKTRRAGYASRLSNMKKSTPPVASA
jgi:hypothetical protein